MLCLTANANPVSVDLLLNMLTMFLFLYVPSFSSFGYFCCLDIEYTQNPTLKHHLSPPDFQLPSWSAPLS